ncbi:MAG: fasciclin domain-containing protein [Planctomycetota bacterium]
MKPLRFSALALTAAAVLGLAAATPAVACHHSSAKASSHSSGDIVDVAASAGTFNTLIAAAQAAGLVDTLKSDGPLTVLAPTDEAFAKLPKGTVESLLKPENKDQLVAILTYHVIPGKVLAQDALKAGEANTVQGDHVSFAVQNGQPRVNGVNLVATDLDASNGVVHVIDEVLLPGSSS